MQRSDSLYIDGKRRAASNGATFTAIISATDAPLGSEIAARSASSIISSTAPTWC